MMYVYFSKCVCVCVCVCARVRARARAYFFKNNIYQIMIIKNIYFYNIFILSLIVTYATQCFLYSC